MNIELKTCPFCGHDDVWLIAELGPRAYVQCQDCGAKSNGFQGKDCRTHAVDAWNTRQAQAQGSEGVDWKALYRFERAMRFMDNKAAMTRDDAYRMADQDIAGMEWHARQTGESPDRTDTAAHAQAGEGSNG